MFKVQGRERVLVGADLGGIEVIQALCKGSRTESWLVTIEA